MADARAMALEPDVDADASPRRLILVMVALMAAFIASALVWMALARIDVAVNARGAVIVPSRLQEVASLEGGIVHRVLVRAGDVVTRGQALVQLDRAQFDAEVGESIEDRRSLQATRIRIDALLAGRTPDFGALEKDAPVLVREERRLWQSSRLEHEAAVAASREAVRRLDAERSEALDRIRTLESAEAVAREALRIEERLFEAGAGARADYLAARQRWLQQSGDLSAQRLSVPRLDAALAQGRAQAAEVEARSRAQWSAQRTEVEGRLAALATTIKGREDKLARRELLSPLDGVVNRVLIPTQGGVAGAGAPIVEVVPHDDVLRISVRVRPADIGFIHAGQEATLRVAAFDASIYGQLGATVERVGADAVLDENRQPFFEVELRSASNHIDHQGQRLALSPGMPVEASILTGERTVMQYLLKPVFKTLGMALRER